MNEHDEGLVDRLQADWDALPAERKELIRSTAARRVMAHQAFDPIWQSGEMSRSDAYGWLAVELGIHKRRCHIQNFNIQECDRVIDICTRRAFTDLIKS